MYTLGPHTLNESQLSINPGGSNNPNAQPIIGVLLQNSSTSYLTLETGGITEVIAPSAPYLLNYDNPTLSPPIIKILPLIPQSNSLYVTVYQVGDKPQIPSVVAAPSNVSTPSSLLLNPLPASTSIAPSSSAPSGPPYLTTLTLGSDTQGNLYATACSVQLSISWTTSGSFTVYYIVYTSSGFILIKGNQPPGPSPSPTLFTDSNTNEKIPIFSGDSIYLGLQIVKSSGTTTANLLNSGSNLSTVTISF